MELLQQARVRDAATAEANDQLALASSQLQGVLDQRALLYRQYMRLRAEWAAERAKLLKAKQEAEASAEEARVHIEGQKSIGELTLAL